MAVTPVSRTSHLPPRPVEVLKQPVRIEFLHEWPYLFWPLPFLVEHPDRTWRLPADTPGEIPLTFSLRATKA